MKHTSATVKSQQPVPIATGACAAAETRPEIWRQAGAPVRSCTLYRDRASAVACPAGAIDLVRATDTGLVSNRAFNPESQVFDADYEETQIFSPRFRAHVDATVARLAGRDLAGARVVEVGCGKGDFLIALCRATGAEGIGIDPSYRADRHSDTSGVRFLTEALDRAHMGLAPDLVICRHTLEHIADLPGFLALLAGLAGGPDVPVLIDVPEAGRVRDEGAFWDVYYEHCHYFTRASLKAVLARAGFDCIDMQRTYGNQFLEVEARLARVVADPADDDWSGFATRAGEQIAFWRDWIAARAGRCVVLWGAGSKAVACVTALGTEGIAAAIDVNPHKTGTFLPGSGLPVLGPEAAAHLAPEAVIVMNPIYREEVATMLADHGQFPEIVALGCPCAP